MSTPSTNPLSIYLIALGAFALGMASYVTAGLIPLIEDAFTVSVAVAAQLVTAFTLAYGLGSPIFVALTPPDRQRSGLLAALALFVIANAASALSTDFNALLAWRAIAGIGAGVYLAMGIGASAALSTAERRGKSIAIIMGGMASGVVLGVPLSLMIADHMGWQAALWLVTLLGLLAFVGLLLLLPALPAAPASSLREKLAILTDGHVVTILLVSLLAAIASLGMYTFIAPLLRDPEYGGVRSVTPFLWAWGIGGVLGSFLVGPVVDRVRGPVLVLAIMLILGVSLFLLPMVATFSAWLAMLPIVLWGAVGWALQVPQNNELILARQTQGDGNLAIALNESALYLGSAIGAAAGGFVLLLQLPIWSLAASAGAVALAGALLQTLNLRRQPAWRAAGRTQLLADNPSGGNSRGASPPSLLRRRCRRTALRSGGRTVAYRAVAPVAHHQGPGVQAWCTAVRAHYPTNASDLGGQRTARRSPPDLRRGRTGQGQRQGRCRRISRQASGCAVRWRTAVPARRAVGPMSRGRSGRRDLSSRVPSSVQANGLREDLYDVGFAQTVANKGDGLVAEPVWQDPLVVVLPARHQLLAHRQIPLDEIARHPLVLCEPEVCEGFWQQLQPVLKLIGTQMTIAERVPTLDLLIALVAAGYGLGFSSLARITELNNPDVTTRPLAGDTTMITTYLVRRDVEPSEQLSRFINRVTRADRDPIDLASTDASALRAGL